jgi:hypothetical protein
MKTLTFTVKDGNFHIEGYADAVHLGTPRESKYATVLKSIALHHTDLEFCERTLQYCAPLVSDPSPEASLLLKMLWTATLALYFKCFGTGVRQALGVSILPAEAHDAHQHFKDLRDKHLIHDVNAFSQAQIGVVVNPPHFPKKVADIISNTVEIVPSADDIQRMYNLVSAALIYVGNHRGVLHAIIAMEHEALTHDELMALSKVTFTTPGRDAVAKGRVDKRKNANRPSAGFRRIGKSK